MASRDSKKAPSTSKEEDETRRIMAEINETMQDITPKLEDSPKQHEVGQLRTAEGKIPTAEETQKIKDEILDAMQDISPKKDDSPKALEQSKQITTSEEQTTKADTEKSSESGAMAETSPLDHKHIAPMIHQIFSSPKKQKSIAFASLSPTHHLIEREREQRERNPDSYIPDVRKSTGSEDAVDKFVNILEDRLKIIRKEMPRTRDKKYEEYLYSFVQSLNKEKQENKPDDDLCIPDSEKCNGSGAHGAVSSSGQNVGGSKTKRKPSFPMKFTPPPKVASSADPERCTEEENVTIDELSKDQDRLDKIIMAMFYSPRKLRSLAMSSVPHLPPFTPFDEEKMSELSDRPDLSDIPDSQKCAYLVRSLQDEIVICLRDLNNMTRQISREELDFQVEPLAPMSPFKIDVPAIIPDIGIPDLPGATGEASSLETRHEPIVEGTSSPKIQRSLVFDLPPEKEQEKLEFKTDHFEIPAKSNVDESKEAQDAKTSKVKSEASQTDEDDLEGIEIIEDI